MRAIAKQSLRQIADSYGYDRHHRVAHSRDGLSYFLSPQKVTKKGFQQEASFRFWPFSHKRTELTGCNFLPPLRSCLTLQAKIAMPFLPHSPTRSVRFWPKLPCWREWRFGILVGIVYIVGNVGDWGNGCGRYWKSLTLSPLFYQFVIARTP